MSSIDLLVLAANGVGLHLDSQLHKLDDDRFTACCNQLEDIYNYNPDEVNGLLNDMRSLARKGQGVGGLHFTKATTSFTAAKEVAELRRAPASTLMRKRNKFEQGHTDTGAPGSSLAGATRTEYVRCGTRILLMFVWILS